MRATHVWLVMASAMLMSACGGGGGGSAQTAAPPPPRTLGVLSTSIADGTVAVGPDTRFTVVFDTNIGANAASTPVVVLSDGRSNLPVTVQKTENTVVVTPASALALRTAYTLTLRAGLTADNGATLPQDVTLRFKTIAAAFDFRTLVPPVTGFGGGGVVPQIAAGDIDGDGRPDVVQVGRLLSQATGEGYSLLVHAQGPTGQLATVQQLDQVLDSRGSSVYIESLVLLDIDGDGRPEILVSQRAPGAVASTGLQVFKRDAAGRFQRGDFITTPYVFKVLVADLDLDGRPDLLGAGVDGFRAFMNRGAGLLAMPIVAVPAANSEFAVGDLDRDGKVDLYVIDRFPPAGAAPRVVYSQRTPGEFAVDSALTQAMSQTCASGRTCLNPVFIDVNADGWLDVIHGSVSGTQNSVAHLRVPGAGFVPGFEVEYGMGVNLFNVADIDRDGLSDLVIVNNRTLGVGLGQRGQTLEYAPAYLLTIFDSLMTAGAVVVIDLDNDGRPDVLGASVNEGVVAMMGRGSTN